MFQCGPCTETICLPCCKARHRASDWLWLSLAITRLTERPGNFLGSCQVIFFFTKQAHTNIKPSVSACVARSLEQFQLTVRSAIQRPVRSDSVDIEPCLPTCPPLAETETNRSDRCVVPIDQRTQVQQIFARRGRDVQQFIGGFQHVSSANLAHQIPVSQNRQATIRCV